MASDQRPVMIIDGLEIPEIGLYGVKNMKFGNTERENQMSNAPAELEDQLPIIITIGESKGNRPPNFTIENAKFWGRPNMAGELDRFKDDRRKFTVIIPDEAVEPLQAIGYNVKTYVGKNAETGEEYEPINHLKVFSTFKFDPQYPGEIEHEKGPDVFVIQGGEPERLNSRTVPILDRSKFIDISMEIRGWEYDPEDSAGQLSARLVQFVGVMQPNLFDSKYGRLR